MACNQTAVAVLQELCMKRRWSPPLYEVLDRTGPCNDPMFEVVVTLSNGIKGAGKGRQKKAAKHDAAQKALAQLQERALPDCSPGTPKAASPKSAINPHEDVGGANPVGELQILCSQKHFPSPIYEVIGDEGEPHEKVFTFKCTVSSRSAMGTARKKQLAKHFAAANLLKILKSNLKSILDEIPNDPAVSSTYSVKSKEVAKETEKKDMESVKTYQALRALRDDIPATPLISPGTRFLDYHTAYASQLKGFKDIMEIPVIKNTHSYMEKLKLIANELHFKITITEDTGKDGRFITFVHLDSDPPSIQAGQGETLEMSLERAAQKVIDFLSVMAS